MKTCAICVSITDAGSMQPLGRDDALVWACDACSGTQIDALPPPRSSGYSEARAKRDMTPGAKLFRVKLARKDSHLTPREAWNTILDTTGVRLLGADNRWAYFERKAATP